MEEEVKSVVELSINYVVGLSNPGTVKIRGKIHGKEVTVSYAQFYIRQVSAKFEITYEGDLQLWGNPRISNSYQREKVRKCRSDVK